MNTIDLTKPWHMPVSMKAPAKAVWLLGVVLVVSLGAQPLPPEQNYVTDIGGSPLETPATTDFATGASFTMEGWFYRTGFMPYAPLMGKALPSPGGDPYLGFGSISMAVARRCSS
jgi:hypothetical protein